MAIWNRFFGGAASTAAGYGVGSALGPTLAPITQDIANEVWALHAHRPLSASLAAQLAARNLWEYKEARIEALQTGVNETRFSGLVQESRHPPTLAELLELRNRDAITEAELTDGIKWSGLSIAFREPIKELRHALAPPSDLIRMAVREAFNPALREALDLDAEFPPTFATRAAKLGISRELAGDYWAAHWELPSFEQGAEMLHRRQLTPDQFDDLLKALDYAPTWRAKLRTIAQRIPPISDMIRFAVREVYSPDIRAELGLDTDYPAEFTAEAALHGMNRERAGQYWAAHWRLPSAQQGYRMLHRGQITTDQLKTLLRALDYPEIWRKRLENIAYNVPGRVDLRRMLAAGVIDPGEVHDGYKRLGYTETDATTLTKFAVELAKPESHSFIPKAEGQLWTTLHRSYVMNESDDATAVARLSLIGVPAADHARILELWRAERRLVRRTLSPAQIRKAYVKGLNNPATEQPWTLVEALAALIDLGYSPEDADVFIQEA